VKFQDEGPKLRQHFEKSTSNVVDETIFKPDQMSPDASSSVSSGASSLSSPDADHSDITALQVAIREQPHGLTTFESSDLLLQNNERWSRFAVPHSTPSREAMEDSTFTDEKLAKFFDSTPFQWVPSPLTQQQQLLYIFTSSLSATTTVELSPALRNHGNWLAYLPPLSGSNPLLDSAIRACTLAHLGHLNHLEHAMHESQAHYGRALRLLSVALQDVNKGMSSETLSATILLSFYEMFASDSDESWVRHAGGAGTLMKMRGPARHLRGFDREIFLAYRHALIISAFEAQTPCFLDDPEWRQLCRQIYEDVCTSGVEGDKLDIFEAAEIFFREMASLPGLICEARNITQVANTTKTDRRIIIKKLSDRTISHRAGLKSAYMQFRAALKRLGHEPSSHMSGDWVFPVRYDYTNVFTGGMCTGYWTVLIVANLTLKELDPSPERIAMCRSENAEAAREICRSSAWMSTSSFLGPFILTFALRVSLLALEDEVQRTWIVEELKKLGATRLPMANQVHMPEAHPDKGMPRVRNAVQGDWDVQAMN